MYKLDFVSFCSLVKHVGSESRSYFYFLKQELKKILYVQVCKEQLSNGKSVVVDNTNPKVEARKSFIQLAQKQGKPRQVILTI